MKRSELPRSSPEQLRAWRRRSKTLGSRSTLRHDGTQRKRPNPARVRAYRLACLDVDSRSGGWCEANVPAVCPPGRHRGEHHHHVMLRAQGGPDEAWNLLHVCHAVHDWAHNVDRAEAERLGIIRRRDGRG